MSESEGPTRENSVTVFQSFTHSALAQRINSALGSFRERKNKQAAENAVLSGVGGLRVGSKGQLEVDKSIWDLTKGVQVEEQQVSPFQRAWEALRQDVKTVVTTIRRDPFVAIIPMVLLLVLLGGGLWAVFASAAKETEHRREVAQQIVGDKGLYLHTELAKAFLPAYVCSVYVRRDPRWPSVDGAFAPLALELIRLSNAGSVLTLSLIPNGIIYTMVPLAGSGPADDKNWRAIGKDWLQDNFNQDKVLQAISTRNLTIIGPYNLTQGGIGLVAMLTINIVGSNSTNTFEVPPMDYSTLPWQNSKRIQDGPNVTNTPFGPYMYDNATNTKWWGLTTVLISWDILREQVLRLDELERQGYDYVLSRPVQAKELVKANRSDLANDNVTHELAVAWSDSVQPVGPNVTNNNLPPQVPGQARPLVYYDLHKRLVEPVSEVVKVEGAQMTLYVALSSGWTPSWKMPLVIVVVVLSVVFSLMLFLMLVNRRQHMRLLHAMIPKKVVSTLRRGKIFTESFEVVTVLFSDIVAYTTMSAQMAPIEVVQMLDELYQEFDNLAEKHRLYKLDTIGDAIMLVGGAPDSEGATAAAARVAQMGLDMIRLTSTKVLAGGHVVKIRVGIHSGPAVAAVVGRKAPKYTLFGDTVNTASRMESNGSPMRIHISGVTAELLAQAGGFVVEPRGEIPIKGKGVMSTYWVMGTHVWSEGPCPRTEAIDISHLTAPPPAATKIPENAEGERAAAAAGQKLPPPPSAPQPHLPRLSSALAATSLSSSMVPPGGSAAGKEGLPSPPVARLAQSSTAMSRQASAAAPLVRSTSGDSCQPEAPCPLPAFASAALGSTAGSRDGPVSARSNLRYGSSHVVSGLDSHLEIQQQGSPLATSLLPSAPVPTAVAAAAAAASSPFTAAAAGATLSRSPPSAPPPPPPPPSSAAPSEAATTTRSEPQLRE